MNNINNKNLMNLNKKLHDRKKQISAKWLNALLDTYKSQGAKFFRETGNEFANPVGATFRDSLDTLLEFLITGERGEGIENPVLGIVRIRAVQGFAPSAATSFVFAARTILQAEAEACSAAGTGEWKEILARIDEMTLCAFDQYMQCREKIWKHKANHLYDRTNKLLLKSNLIEEVTD